MKKTKIGSGKYIKQFWIFLLLSFLVLPAKEIMAASQTEEWQTCDVYNGLNTEYQDYSTWYKPIYSYLTPLENGEMMRVQFHREIDGILVEYYDANYSLKETKIIKKELPLMGGFYATDSNYFLLTGQKNPDESADVEVYRITKYDKNWNRIDSAGLYDCNTTCPFDAGSARMDVCGKYLLIHTCHEMYKSSDGNNHQANVTIQLDMETMKITDSFTDVMNWSYGYISHSFNQFIKIEDNHIITVDHGDAFPRSIALLKYNTDVSTGKFTSDYYTSCSLQNIMSFPGAIGQNYTNASVGGFELSSSSYLIAGNSVIQDKNNLSRETRNIFVAASDKETDSVNIHWLTNYEEGDGTTSTPHMVKVSDTRYVILWSRNKTVYYTTVNGEGEQTSDIYEISGNLSDCDPVVINDKVVWYVWKNEKITFYEISLTDLSKNTKKNIKNGHDYENKGVSNGYATLKCIHCGGEKSLKAATSMSLWWNETEDSNIYSSRFSNKKEVGDKLKYWVSSFVPDDANTEMEVLIKDPEIISCTPTNYFYTFGVLTACKTGKTTVTFRSKYNPSLEKTYTIYVNGPLQVDSFTADMENQARKGKTITLNADAIGGSWKYTYKFYVEENGKHTVIRDYSSASSCTWISDTTGKKKIFVDVKDSEGTVATKSMDYEIISNGLSENSFDFRPEAELVYDGQGKSVTLSGKEGVAEGLGTVTVKYYDAEGNQINGKPIYAGTYTVKIDLSEGEVYGREKDLTYPSWQFTIEKAKEAPNVPSSVMSVSHGLKTVGKITMLPKNWRWSDTDKETDFAAGETVTATANYIGADAGNYEKESQTITITADTHCGGTATCNKKATCEVCKEEYGELDKTNHKSETEIKDAKKATCTEDGYSGDVYCKGCGEKLENGYTITASGHQWLPATCNQKSICKNCGEEQGQPDKTNHTGETEIKEAKTATCTEDGYSGDIYCKDCGEKLETGYLITAIGHQWLPATCCQKSICKNCGEQSGLINPSNHTGGTVVRNAKAATLTKNGYSGDIYCKGCGALLQKGQITQPSQAEAAKQISSIKNDGDVPGTVFAKLSARMVKVSKTSIKLKWNKVSGASGYIIYGNKCGAKNRFVKIVTLQGGARTTYTHSKLKKVTYYKYIITAYRNINGAKAVISTSKTMHIVTLGGKYANPSSVKTAKTKVTLKKGGSFNLKAKAILPKGKKAQNHKKLSYESSNKTIATVSSKGIVKGKKKGSCYIYAYAQNGVYKKVKVTVK